MNRGVDNEGGRVVTLDGLREQNRQQFDDLIGVRQENVDLRTALGSALRRVLEVSKVLGSLTKETLRFSAESERLSAENGRVSEDNKRLSARVKVLEEQLVQALQAGKRQAAPFRREKRIPESEQKKSGRGKGHKPAHRPRPDHVDETIQVPMACNCPDCGMGLVDVQEHEHFVVDIPPVRPKTTRFVTWSGKCPHCKARHQSKHPDLPSTAVGAAGITLGHNVVAMAALMRAQLGAPLRKIAMFLGMVFGLSVSAAGVLGALKRLTVALKPTYQGLMTGLRTCKVLHVDETGWRLCSKSAWLWVFTNKEVTIYVIRHGRGHKVLLEVLGREFTGWLVTDCLATYDSPLFPNKGKCVAHFFRALSDLEALHMKPKELPCAGPPPVADRQADGKAVLALVVPAATAPLLPAEVHTNPKELPSACPAVADKQADGKAVLSLAVPAGAVALAPAEVTANLEDHTKFPEQAKFILAMAVNLKRNQPQLSGEIYEGTRSVIHYLLDNLLSEEITEPNNLRLANRMRKHRQAMLAFLDHVEVEPTNNLAERQIRPGVLQRKISAGNRSEGGAEIHSTLLSIFATAMQQGYAFLAVAIKALRNPANPVLALSTRPP